MQQHHATEALADQWLEMMSKIGWQAAADSIRQQAPAPCGETTQVQEHGVTLEVSDSWHWLEGDGGDIQLIVEVFEPAASEDLVATRKHIIRRP